MSLNAAKPLTFKPADHKKRKNVKEFQEDETQILKHPWRKKLRTRWHIPNERQKAK